MVELIKDGKRVDGRDFEELRKIKIEVNPIPNANGSALFSFGNTIAIAAVYGPRSLYPKFLQEKEETLVRVRYNMAPFSTETRKNPGIDRRSIEISKVIKNAIENSIFSEEYPRTVIDCYAEVLSGDGSTRVTSLNALSISLALAGIKMKDLIAACTAGRIGDKIIVDLNQLEDNYGDCDISFAMLLNTNEIVLLQLDGEIKKDEFLYALKVLKEKCKIIREEQERKIKEYFEKNA